MHRQAASPIGRAPSIELGSRDKKMQAIADVATTALRGSVLDVGARDRELSSFASGRYVAVDLEPTQGAVAADLESGLPFGADSFDAAFALDVLEHCDDIVAAFTELCRVAQTSVVVVLPNAYQLSHRLRYVRGHKPSGKYGLAPEPPKDRHRWLLSITEAREFLAAQGRKHGFRIADEFLCYPSYRRPLPRRLNDAAMAVSPKGAALFAKAYLAHLTA